ncbi:MAG: hypothetical protein MHPSP_000316, partial [Paramarteilia canceri]
LQEKIKKTVQDYKEEISKQKLVLDHQIEYIEKEIMRSHERLRELEKERIFSANSRDTKLDLHWSKSAHNLPESVLQYYRTKIFLDKFGKTNGWKSEDHVVFAKYFQRSHPDDTNTKELIKYLPHYSVEEIKEHCVWYKELQKLKSDMNNVLEKWKDNKNLKFIPDSEQTDVKSVRYENDTSLLKSIEKSNLQTKRNIEIWREERNRKDMEKKIRDEKLKYEKLSLERRKFHQNREKVRKRLKTLKDNSNKMQSMKKSQEFTEKPHDKIDKVIVERINNRNKLLNQRKSRLISQKYHRRKDYSFSRNDHAIARNKLLEQSKYSRESVYKPTKTKLAYIASLDKSEDFKGFFEPILCSKR